MLRKKILIILLLLINSSYIYAAKKFIIDQINFQGLQRITYDTALLGVPFRIGETIDGNDINHAINSLYATGNFENITVLINGNKLIIKVKESPVINNISFSGNKNIKNDQLDKLFTEYGLYSGEFLNRSNIFHVENIIKDFYYSIGKYNSKINLKIDLIKNNKVDIKLIIIEGISTKIKQINILGNHVYSVNYLLSQLNLRDSINWWDLFKSNKYEKQKLFQDFKSLSSLYLNSGYAKFNINSTQISLTPDKKYAFITINILEGKKYKIFDTVLQGPINQKYFKDINKIIKIIRKKEIYNHQKISSIEQKIKKYLDKYGYVYPEIKTYMEINDKTNFIKIIFFVNPKNKYFVRQLIFTGNNKTKDIVLRREMRQIEGSLLNNDMLEQGKDRLNRTGYFDYVNFYVKKISNSSNKVDVFYQVKERNTGVLNAGLGYGTESGINFQVGINQDNLLGSGNFLGINATKNSSKTHAELSFNNPYFTIDGISLGSSIFYDNFKARASSISDYNNQSYGLELMSGFPINEYNKVRIGFSFIHNLLSNIQPQITIKRYLDSIKKYSILNHSNAKFSINDITFNYGWTYNNLDRVIFPILGNLINLNGKITLPKSDNNFYKINIDIKNYLPINKKNTFILLTHGHLGYGRGIFNKYLPFYENFYGGGFNTVRGFHINTIGPKAIYYNKNLLNCSTEKILCTSNDAIGGDSILTISLEMIIPNPLFKMEYSNSLRTSIFFDAGTVWDSKWKNSVNTYLNKVPDYSNSRNIRISSGISLQWLSPIGPLNFSYSYPIKKFSGDVVEPFQFNINNTW